MKKLIYLILILSILFPVNHVYSIGGGGRGIIGPASIIDGVTSRFNSTKSSLVADAIFIGLPEKSENYNCVHVTTFSDEASAIGGLQYQISSDGLTGWRTADAYTVPANTEKTYSFQANKKFYRVIYINGDMGQSMLDLQTSLKKFNCLASSHKITDTISTEDDARLVKAVVTMQDINGNYINHGTNNPLPVVDLNGTSIAQNNIEGYSNVQKFGHVEILGGTLQTIWGQPTIYAYPDDIHGGAIAMTLSSSDIDDTGIVLSSGTATGGTLTTLIDTGADFVSDGVAIGDIVINDSNIEHGIVTAVTDLNTLTVSEMKDDNKVGSSNDSGDSYRIVNANDTGAAVVHVFGVDANHIQFDEYVVLNGQNGVSTSGIYLRAFRAIIRIAGSSGWNEGDIYMGTAAIVAGVPTNIFTFIEATENQTLQAFYTVPANKVAYLTRWNMTVGTGKEMEAKLVIRQLGEVFANKQEWHISEIPYTQDFSVPLRIDGKSDIEVRGLITSPPGVAVASGFDLILIDKRN